MLLKDDDQTPNKLKIKSSVELTMLHDSSTAYASYALQFVRFKNSCTTEERYTREK